MVRIYGQHHTHEVRGSMSTILRVLYAHNPLVKEYMDAHHGKLWSRSKFNEISKVDYVTNNLVECFNAKIKSLKGLMLWQAFDKIRQMIMIEMDVHKRIAKKICWPFDAAIFY